MEEKNTCNFGEHLMLDGYQGDPEKLNDKELVLRSLTELPELLGMHRLSEPEIYFAKSNKIKDPGGWSGFVVIMESHISVHTFPARGFVSIDAYTCKNGMDTAFVVNYFKKMFDLKDVETNFVKRGTKYPVCDIC
ncbi:MAG: adenosylmethionine decarboxylase [Parcubacteria group bacterium]|jgi:S-adenosylmethionine decarboxylase